MITIVLATHARGYNLPAIIGSVIDQTYTDWRLLVSDNGDGSSGKIVREIAEKNPSRRIEYVHYPEAVYKAGAHGMVSTARGFTEKYLVLFQDDTIYLDREFLGRAAKILDEHPDVIYVAGGWRSGGRDLKFWDHDLIIPGMRIWENWPRVWLFYSACVFRYGVYMGVGISTAFHADSALLLKTGMMGNVALLNTVCIQDDYNKQGSGIKHLWTDPMDALRAEYEYLREVADFAVSWKKADRKTADWWVRRIMGAALSQAIANLPSERADELTDWLHNNDMRLTDDLVRRLVASSGQMKGR